MAFPVYVFNVDDMKIPEIKPIRQLVSVIIVIGHCYEYNVGLLFGDIVIVVGSVVILCDAIWYLKHRHIANH